jgi:hypothetical protein
VGRPKADVKKPDSESAPGGIQAEFRSPTRGAAKLTWDDAREIRQCAQAGVQQSEIATVFRISRPLWNEIVRGHIWNTDAKLTTSDEMRDRIIGALDTGFSGPMRTCSARQRRCLRGEPEVRMGRLRLLANGVEPAQAASGNGCRTGKHSPRSTSTGTTSDTRRCPASPTMAFPFMICSFSPATSAS